MNARPIWWRRSSARSTRCAWAHQAKTTLCNLEQRPPRFVRTIAGMHPNHAKAAIVAGWILGLGTIAWATTLTSSGGWTLFLTWGLLQPLLLIRLRKQQEQTVSELIQEALR